MRIYLNFLTLIAAFSFDADCAPNENVTIDNRIINGEAVTETNPLKDVFLKYQVSIRLDEDDRRCYGDGHICGGVMIEELTVLTSASCLNNLRARQISVWMGNIDIFKSAKDNPDIFTSAVEEIRMSPNHKENKNDIAVLKLMNRNKNFNNRVLQMSKEVLPEVKRDCLISGWGRSTKEGEKEHILRIAMVHIMPSIMCKSIPPEGIFCSRFSNDLVTPGGQNRVFSDFCYEDIGGPLVCKEGRGFMLYGLMHNSFCGEKTSDAWYTDIGYYMKWIRLVADLEANGAFSNLKNSFQLTCSALIILNFLNVI